MSKRKFSLDHILQFLIILSPLSITIGKAGADIWASSIAVLYLLNCAIKKDCSFLLENWLRYALILWAYSIIRGLFTADAVYSLTKTIPWVRFIFFAAAIQAYAMKNPKIVKQILITTAVAAIFLTIDSLFQYFTGKDFFGKSLFQEAGYIRLTGPYSKMVVGYIITTLSLPFISYLIFKLHWQKGHYLKNIFYSSIILLIYTTVLMSGERSALIQITCGILMILAAAKININNIMKMFFAILFITIMAYFLMPQVFQRQFLSVYHIARNFNDSVYGILWDAGIRLGLNNVFLGIGPSNFEEECLKFASFCRSHPHNIFIEWFAEYGIIGLILFLFFIITILLEVKNFYLGIERKYYKYILTGLLAAFIVKLLPLPSSGFFKNWYGVPFWFIIGWMMAFKNPNYSNAKFKQ